ncbi:MAG: hypothetical protein COA92_07095 [Sulfurovum sp.]|nr:MAG: hypothetical protein COA92_07095 [Sulfurovum sp.]
MVNIIDLHLLEHSKELKPTVFLNEAIEKNNIVVILGSPGSGKTSILHKYADNEKEAQFLKIKKFIKFDNQVKENTKVLLLDGLDEYRSVSTDKTFVIEELAHKLQTLNDIKIVISCREMDWYGESDKSALKDELDSEAVVFSVQLLTAEKQMEMANIYDVENPESFIDKFSSYGFLDNPQMFKMIIELYKTNNEIDFNSKAALYEAFIKGAKEKNEERNRNQSQLTSDEILKYSGYLAFYYMFTDVESFEDEFIDKITGNDNNFSKMKLLQVLNTSLFDTKIFIHRTIAEFALAHFLVKEKMTDGDSLANERIKVLFVKKGKIPTEVRGVYAWLCSLSGDMSLIDVDSYYQAVYGDNSLFNELQKKEIVLSVKEYADEHPWFIDFWNIHGQVDGLSLLYENSLDDFYIEQIEEAKSSKNHYMDFIIFVLNTSNILSKKIKKYLREKIFDSGVPTHVKDDILKVFSSKSDFLLKVLNDIRDEKIEDNDNILKEFLLKRLYLNVVQPNDVIKYLQLYSANERGTIGHGLYIFKTPYEEKLALAKGCLKLKQKKHKDKNKNRHEYYGSDFMGKFVSDYLYETIIDNPNNLSIENIYDILFDLNQYVYKYKAIKVKAYALVRKSEIIDDLEELLMKFSNKLFSTYIDKAIKQYKYTENEKFRSCFYEYNYFFSYKPDNIFNILLSKIKLENHTEINKALFLQALTYIPFGYDENIENYKDKIEKLKKISDKYGFNNELAFRLSDKLPEWMIENKKEDKKDELERLEILNKNEEYFTKRTGIEISTAFGDLKYISDLIYIDSEIKEETEYLSKETFVRLKRVLKNLIYHNSIDKSLTILDSLSKLTERERYIEQVYYTSLALNNFEDHSLFSKIDESLLEYLYIVSLMHNNVGNIVESNFSENFEKVNINSVEEILKTYIQLIIEKHYLDLEFVYTDFIANERDFKKLKRIAFSRQRGMGILQETLLKAILSTYGFEISIGKLKEIHSCINKEHNNDSVISALIYLHEDKKNQFTKQMASALHEIFDYTSFFEDISSEWKIKVIDYMFTVFDTEKSIEHVSGFQSSLSQCASFLRDVIKTLNILELKALYVLHNSETNIWRNRILNEIDTKEQQDADQNFDRYSIDKLKNFVLSNAVLSKEDFFSDITIKLTTLKQEIEGNRNNEKNQFYNEDGSSKNEESCRDAILQKLNDKYGYDIESSKEKHEADNRVDINIRYKANLDYEVQIECKKDKNRDLYKGIKNQLIDKYLSSKVEFGIYLIFYFGDKANKDDMLVKIKKSVPDDYKGNIKIICIDLVK